MYDKYPRTVWYKVVSKGEDGFDTTFPNQTLKQIKFWKKDEVGFDNLWMDYGKEYRELLDEIPKTGADAWSTATWFNWEDSNLGIPNAACRLSVRGYIHADIANELHPDLDATTPANQLPTLRYILPIPEDAIMRSNNTYKNYYGY